MSLVDSRVSCIVNKIVSLTQNATTCDYRTSIIQSRYNAANQSVTFYLINIITARFRRNPRDDLARKKARNTCWKSVFKASERNPLRDPWLRKFRPELTALEKLAGEIDQGWSFSSPHPLRRSSDWMLS